eukprot:s2604_g5.t1
MSSGSLVGSGMTLQDVQMKEAQAELLLLQCWGEDSVTRAEPESSSKRHSQQEEEESEDKSSNKWARPESKGGFGRGGRGKGNQASSQDRQLLLRHEDQMGIDKTENNFVMFFKKDSALSLVPTFVKKAEHWHSLKEQKQAKTDELALPLRTFLFHSMLEALLLRLKETTQSQDQLSTAMTLQVFLPKEENQDLMIPFLKFDPETKVLTPLPDRQEIAVTEMINKIQELQKLCLCQLVVLRFHSTQNPERMGRSALAVIWIPVMHALTQRMSLQAPVQLLHPPVVVHMRVHNTFPIDVCKAHGSQQPGQRKICILGEDFASGLQEHSGLDRSVLPGFLGGQGRGQELCEVRSVPLRLAEDGRDGFVDVCAGRLEIARDVDLRCADKGNVQSATLQAFVRRADSPQPK